MWTLMDTAGDALVMDAAVLTRLNIFGVFVSKYKYALSWSVIPLSEINRPLLLDILKWFFGFGSLFWGFFGHSFYLDLVRGSSNRTWLRWWMVWTFQDSSWVFVLSFLPEFWKEEVSWLLKIALLHSTFLSVCIVNIFWVDFKIVFPSLVKFHQIHN